MRISTRINAFDFSRSVIVTIEQGDDPEIMRRYPIGAPISVQLRYLANFAEDVDSIMVESRPVMV